jgi:hypothetical protein
LPIEAEVAAGGEIHAHRVVVLQVGAHTRQGVPHGNAMWLEIRRSADAGKLQQLR